MVTEEESGGGGVAEKEAGGGGGELHWGAVWVKLPTEAE